MASRVVWSPKALAAVEAIAEFIALDSPSYAGAVVNKIIERTTILEKFPNSGRVVPEIGE